MPGLSPLEPDGRDGLGEALGPRVGKQPVLRITGRVVGRLVDTCKGLARRDGKLAERRTQFEHHLLLLRKPPLSRELQWIPRPGLDLLADSRPCHVEKPLAVHTLTRSR